MTATEEFQNRHGARWAVICAGPELGDALVAVNADLFIEIANMSSDQIIAHGAVTLARLQGALQHERALIDLSIIHPDISGDLPPATYPDPSEEELEIEVERDAQTSASPFQEYQQEEAAKAIKPKRKYARRKSRKK